MNEIKKQLFIKYSKEIKELGFTATEFQKLELTAAARNINFIFDSKGQECPPDLLKYLGDESDNDQEVAGSYDSNGDSNDPIQMAIQASKEEFSRQQQASFTEMKQLNIPSFDISKFRYLSTDEEIAQQRGISCEKLFENRKDIVKDLANFDDVVGIRYKDLIEKYNVSNQPKSGIIISILLHSGDRISKLFESEDVGSSIYYWAASQDKMIKDNIKPGHFIIIRNTGEEIFPEIPIKDQITEKQILLNVRLL